MRLPDLKFTELPDGDILIESQYVTDVGDRRSTRARGRLANIGQHWIFVGENTRFGVNALGLPEMEQIVAKMKELELQK